MSTALSKQADRFAETTIDDEVVLMDLNNGDFFSLSGSGLDVWKLIDGTRDRGAILAALAEEYTMTAADLADDVDAFLAGLVDVGYLAAA